MKSDVTAISLTVLAILNKWEWYDWSVQGFGLLRLYIGGVGRLHIWDSTLRYPNVSMIHNHSWDLKSTVVCGRLVNERFDLTTFGMRYMRQRLLTGYDSKMIQEAPEEVSILNRPKETYLPGEIYVQHAAEIHQTIADDGTVTVMARREDDGPGYADVLWHAGTVWGSAKPRPATGDEVHATVNKAIPFLESQL